MALFTGRRRSRGADGEDESRESGIPGGLFIRYDDPDGGESEFCADTEDLLFDPDGYGEYEDDEDEEDEEGEEDGDDGEGFDVMFAVCVPVPGEGERAANACFCPDADDMDLLYKYYCDGDEVLQGGELSGLYAEALAAAEEEARALGDPALADALSRAKGARVFVRDPSLNEPAWMEWSDYLSCAFAAETFTGSIVVRTEAFAREALRAVCEKAGMSQDELARCLLGGDLSRAGIPASVRPSSLALLLGWDAAGRRFAPQELLFTPRGAPAGDAVRLLEWAGVPLKRKDGENEEGKKGSLYFSR